MNDYYTKGNFTKRKLPCLGLLKHQFLLFAFMAFSFASYGQLVSEYTFEQSVGTYIPVTNGTNMVLSEIATSPFDTQFFHNSTNGLNGTTTGGTYNAFPIGFDFTYAGNTFDGFYIGTDGWIKLGSTSGSLVGSAGSVPISTTTTNTNNIISAFGMDLAGSLRVTAATRTLNSPIFTITGAHVSVSPYIAVGMRIVGTGIPNNTTVVAVDGNTITMSANATSSSTFATAAFVEEDNISYLTTGDVGSRVLTVQWKNVVRWSGFGDLLNFQIKLYETSNKIEIVYNNIASPNATLSSSIQVGLKSNLSPNVFSNRTGLGANAWTESTAGTLSSSTLPFRGPAASGGEISVPQGLIYSYLVPVFVDPPACIATPTLPTNNATNIIATNFSWPSTTGAPTGYFLSVGINPEANNLLDSFDVGLVNTYNYQDLVLSPSTQYFWKITPYNENGESQGCVTWSFTSGNVPNCVTNFAPADGATNVVRNPSFTWTNPSNPSASSFDVYFGTSAEPMLLGNYASAAAATAALPTPLAANTQYYVKVVPKNVLGEAQGCVTRTFTTGSSFLFCASGSTDSADSKVGSFTLAGSTRPAATGCVTYTNRTGDAPFVLEQGTPSPVSISHGTCSFTFYSSYAKVFIDVNQNGVFDANEMFFEGAFTAEDFGSNAGAPINGTITLPLTALTGNTRLRLVFRESGTTTDTQACGTYGYGETQDYTVTILPAASCAMPTNITSSNATTTTVSLAWDVVSSADYYEIEYGISGFTFGDGTLVDDADVSPYILEGLTPDSNYQFYIRSVCGNNDNSNWAGPFSFTTLPTCSPVTGVSAVSQGYTEAVVSWTGVDGASTYNIQYGTSGFELGEGTILEGLEASPFTISSLTVGTTYDVYVQSNCGANGTSQWSAVASVTPGPCIPTYTYGKTDGDLISNIAIVGTTLSNSTGAAPVNPSYTFFTGLPNYTAELRQGTTYTVSVTVGTYGSQNLAAWIDFNENAVFEASERIGFTSASIGANGTASFQIQLPLDAPLGTFRLRVRDVYNTTGINIQPCLNYNYGETEDYNITIIEPITTVMNPDFCGTTLSMSQFTGQFLGAVAIPDVQEYEFRIQNEEFITTAVSADGQFNFSNFVGHQFNTTYNVSVRVKVADAYGPYSETCQITTPVAPIIPIEASYCNTIVENTQYERFYAEENTDATQWIFKIDNGTDSFEVTRNVDYAHFYDFAPNIAYGTTYQVSVSAKIGGAWTGFGPSCAIGITAEPKTDILYNTCGTTLPNIASNITLKPVDLANMYRMTIKNMTTNVEVSMDQTSRLFRISNFSNSAYNTAFEVKAQVSLDGGATFFAANTPCVITTPALPIVAPDLVPASCGITVTRLNEDIYTPWVNDNAIYCFHVSVNGEFLEEKEMPTRRFRLTDLSVAPEMGTVYDIKVRIKLLGAYSDYGNECSVSTPSVPLTQLSNATCNSNISGFGTTLRAAWVNNQVNAFMFAIVDAEMNIISEVERATEDVKLTMFPDFTPQLGTTYLIRVKVRIGNTWGEYGNTCSVTTPGGSQTVTRMIDEVSVFDVKAYPNPFDQALTLSIESSSDSALEINVYDMTGKLVNNIKHSNGDGSVTIGEQLAAGVYHVQVVQDGNIKTLKVVKK